MLLLKREYADYANNKEIYNSEKKKVDLKDDPYFGAACLMEVKKADKKRWVTRKDGEEVVIQDVGYKWLTLFPKEENFAIIAIYNVNNEFVQFIFNIGKNVQYKAKIPYLDDLYLDVVLRPDGETILLDEYELKEAFDSLEMTKEEYQETYKIAYDLIEKIKDNQQKVKAFTDKYLKEML